MIARSRFFLASLWAALGPALLLVVVATGLLLFPNLHKLGEFVSQAGGLALLLVPCAYTAAVVGTYVVARALYDFRVLSRRVFIAAYSVLAVLCALLLTVVLGAGSVGDILRAFALFLSLSLVASGSAAFIWWRAATRGAPTPGDPRDDDAPEPRQRVRRRRSRGGFLRRIASRM